MDAISGEVSNGTVVEGEVTSAVPNASGGYIAALGSRLVRIGQRGPVETLTKARSVPFRVHSVAGGGVMFMDTSGSHTRVRYSREGRARTLARGALGKVRVTAGAGGRVFVTGEPKTVGHLPDSVRRLKVPADATVSTRGHLALTRAAPDSLRGEKPRLLPERDPDETQPVSIRAVVPATGKQVAFTVEPDGDHVGGASRGRHSGRELSPALGGAHTHAGSDTRDSARSNGAGAVDGPLAGDRTCAVPRNDPDTQVYQPTVEQVEWAADLAVTSDLTITRPSDWKQSGLSSWSPQGMFPPISLDGGGHVPPQILLGVLVQESNLEQASWHAVPGEAGNPLVGNYFGRGAYDDDPSNDWDINWDDADCGYGVGQITDGMRRGSDQRTEREQRAIAVDYATNIAAAVRILEKKWNTLHQHGMTVNNDDPAKIENWFMAAWAYNSGFHPPGNGKSPYWGVGWFNNPINPIYPADRDPFLEDSYADAADPQFWPYPEKVIGWAAYPIVKPDYSTDEDGDVKAGYMQAYWIVGGEKPGGNSGEYSAQENRHRAKPPRALFCESKANDCHPGETHPNKYPDQDSGPCAQYDLRCWWSNPVTWKPDCWTTCGFAQSAYSAGDSEPAGIRVYPPNCSRHGLPDGALIVDDVPAGVDPVDRDCRNGWGNVSTVGSFTLDFATNSNGEPTSRIDFHQIGGGFGGHFWFAHTRAIRPNFTVTGTWRLDRQMHQWARVLVHMPDHGAQTQQAHYRVHTGGGKTADRFLLQRTHPNDRWESLGVFHFDGTPTVTLDSHTYDGDGSEDIAWDAIAFQPLPTKPDHFVVAMGDSYSAGEGASDNEGHDYYNTTDNHGGGPHANLCHRSRKAWSRKTTLPDKPGASIGSRADSWAPDMDFHLVACSGAESQHLLPDPQLPMNDGRRNPTNAFGQDGRGQFGQVSQIDRGFLNENTTLVTFSIGGNDARFADVFAKCIKNILTPCPDDTLDGTSDPVKNYVPHLIRTKVKQSVLTNLRVMHRRAPNAQILLVGYPHILSHGVLDDFCGISGLQISEPEYDWLHQTGTLLNRVLGDTASNQLHSAVEIARNLYDIPVSYANPIPAFGGKGVCGDPQLIHGIVSHKSKGEDDDKIRSNQSFHPNKQGIMLYAQVVSDKLSNIL